MPKDEDTKSTPSIWKWENTAHITKTVMQAGFAIALVALAATAIYAAAKGAALPLAFLAQPWVIAAIVSYVAVYFIATAISSYQQMNAIGEKGAPGAPGKDADLAALISDVIKSGTIVEETIKEGNQRDVKQLHLKLSKDDYEALTNGKSVVDEVTLNVLLEGKSVEVKFKHVAANDNGNYKVQLTSVNDKDQAAEMKAELGMATDSKSLKVAVNDKDFEALKNGVPSKLGEVAVKEAISRVTTTNGKQF